MNDRHQDNFEDFTVTAHEFANNILFLEDERNNKIVKHLRNSQDRIKSYVSDLLFKTGSPHVDKIINEIEGEVETFNLFLKELKTLPAKDGIYIEQLYSAVSVWIKDMINAFWESNAHKLGDREETKNALQKVFNQSQNTIRKTLKEITSEINHA